MFFKGVEFRKTGAIRPPRKGEWFKGSDNRPVCAQFNMAKIDSGVENAAMVWALRCRPILEMVQ